jgi:hypothetical protein
MITPIVIIVLTWVLLIANRKTHIGTYFLSTVGALIVSFFASLMITLTTNDEVWQEVESYTFDKWKISNDGKTVEYYATRKDGLIFCGSAKLDHIKVSGEKPTIHSYGRFMKPTWISKNFGLDWLQLPQKEMNNCSRWEEIKVPQNLLEEFTPLK